MPVRQSSSAGVLPIRSQILVLTRGGATVHTAGCADSPPAPLIAEWVVRVEIFMERANSLSEFHMQGVIMTNGGD